jgi:hypothetical protein
MNQLALFASPNLRALVTTAEAQTQPCFWEFLAAQIRNKHTRRAYSAKHAICSRVRSALLPESAAPDASDLGNGCEESPRVVRAHAISRIRPKPPLLRAA